MRGDFSNSPPPKAHVPAPVPKVTPTPPPAKPVEKPLTEQEKELRDQEFIKDLYAEFLTGSLRIEFVPTAHYDYLKVKGLMKMSQQTTDQIREKARTDRINELKGSMAPADVKLLGLYQSGDLIGEGINDIGFLKMAKRLALIEFFTQLKARHETCVFNMPKPESC